MMRRFPSAAADQVSQKETNASLTQKDTKVANDGVKKISSRTSLVTDHFTVLKESASKTQIAQDSIRFVCISDTHSQVENNPDFLSAVPDGDVLLHAGDFTMHGDVDEFVAFNRFLGQLSHPIKLLIPGNHEDVLDPRALAYNVPALRAILGLPPCKDAATSQNYKEVRQALANLIDNGVFITDKTVNICGIKIHGFPWIPRHGALGFGLKRNKELSEAAAQIPDEVDILLSHGPAKGFGDLTMSGKHAGCDHLAANVTERIKPKLVISGHIHEGYGVFTNGETTFINASVCTQSYRPKQPAIVVDYKLPESFTRSDFSCLRHQDLKLISSINQQSSLSSSSSLSPSLPPQPPSPPPPLPPRKLNKPPVI